MNDKVKDVFWRALKTAGQSFGATFIAAQNDLVSPKDEGYIFVALASAFISVLMNAWKK